jgi:potassium efflux system protein
LLLSLLIVVLIGLAQTASARPGKKTNNGPIAQQITQLKNQMSTLNARKDIAKGVRKRADKIYQQAISTLQSAQDDQQQAAQLRQTAAAAPDKLAEIHAQLHKLNKSRPLANTRSLSPTALSKKAKALRTQLSDTQSKLSDLSERLSRITQRPGAIRSELNQARNALQSLAGQTKTAKKNQAPAVNNAQRALLTAKRTALKAKIGRLQQEQASLSARQHLLEAKRSLAKTRVAHINQRMTQVQAALGHKQHESAQSLKNQSQEKLYELHGALAPLAQAAQRNVALADELAKITRQSEGLAARQDKAKGRVNTLKQRLNLVQRQLEIGGSSVALSDALRAQKRQLASSSQFFSAGNKMQDVSNLAAANLRRFQFQQKRAALDNPAALATTIAKKAGVYLDPGQRRSLINLLRKRRAIVDLLIDAEGRYVDIGRDINSLAQQYGQTLASLTRLLNERLFWLPTFHPLRISWPAQVVADLPWAFNPAAWKAAAVALGVGISVRPFVAAGAVIAIAFLIGIRRTLRRWLARLREPVGNVRHDTFGLTLRAALATVLLSLPGVVLLLSAGSLMRAAPDAGRFTQAVAAGVSGLGILALFIEPFVHVCRTNGLADGHFQWPADARQGLYRSLRRLFVLLVLPVLFFILTEAFNDDSKSETIGRAAFMLSALAIAGFSWRLLHPKQGVLANVLGATHKSYWRLGYLWLPLAFGVPVAMCGLAAWGYYYTAQQIQSRFFYSAALLGGCMILYSLIVRWLMVTERRLALARALRKRAEAREARAAREAASAAGESAPDTLENLEIDLVQISEQSRGLIQLFTTLAIGGGLWLIWSNMLPALHLLNNVTLWHYSAQVNGKTQPLDVTLGSLLLALVVGVGTFLGGRNLPGFLEITLLRRLSMKPGSRYAMATLFKYAIVVIGLLAAVGIIGLRWSSVQWLVAALGVGLGFGLQQIFADFISGIIILFERPIRVGDIVTVGSGSTGLTGTVSRIRLRATTVIDWDNKEVVIPNQTLITGTVTNWTLSDDITRFIMHVRLAFDADTDLAEKLIMDAIVSEPAALDDPAPSVFLVGYDSSALLYEARVYFHGLYNWLPLQHTLYKRIHSAFAAHDIEVTFPQQGLHLRSVDPSFARVFGSGADERDTDDLPQTKAWPGGGGN